MAEKTVPAQREYVIPLRRQTKKTPRYQRTARAIRTIKQFIARHMRVPERDTKKVKLDVYFNNDLWFRGRRKPPAKIKVKATRIDDNVIVDFVEIPDHVKFERAKIEKRHLKVDKKKVKKEEPKKVEEKTAEEKKEEKEKAQASAEQNLKQLEADAKTQKHTVKGKAPQVQRKALKK